MKESEGGSSAPLDTCRLTEKSGVAYSMTLLALCGFHGRKEMVDVLLKEGAGNTGVIFPQDKRVWHIPVICRVLGCDSAWYLLQTPKAS